VETVDGRRTHRTANVFEWLVKRSEMFLPSTGLRGPFRESFQFGQLAVWSAQMRDRFVA